MSRSKKQEKGKRPRGSLSQYGLFDIPGVDSIGQGENLDLDDDEDLEAELNAILGGPPKTMKPVRQAPGLPGGVDTSKLDSMIAMSMKDQPSEDEEDDDDDPSLLAELGELTGISEPIETEHNTGEPATVESSEPEVQAQPAGEDTITMLKERLDLYVRAEQFARQNNDSSKARRYKRGIDQLKVLVKKAESGVSINTEDIPVPIAVPKPSAVPLQPQPKSESLIDLDDGPPPEKSTQPLENRDEIIATLIERREQYKAAAVAAKRSNDIESALSYVKIIKQFEIVLQAVEKGHPVDLSTMPPPPPSASSTSSQVPLVPQPDQVSPEQPLPPPAAQSVPSEEESSASAPQPDNSTEELTVLGALESRLAKYMEQEESAKREGNSSKVRRMGRIVKQYKDAISLHKRGKPIPVDELPTPPGFPPIPVDGGDPSNINPAGESAPAPEPSRTAAPAAGSLSDTLESASLSPGSEKRVSLPAPTPQPRPSASPTPSQTSSTSSKGGTQTRSERQLAVLLLRQREYKEAALKAKQANDLVKAKEYLRLAKGFDSVIEATRSGLPVDIDTLPRPISKKSPELDTFEIIRIADCIEGSDSEIFERLITDLNNQLKMCIETLNHFKAIGDIANANRFENLACNTKKDLNTVRGAHITSSPPPKFHYEQRTFSIVRCNVDLNDNDLELCIIKGINYNVPNPKEIDTYVRYEFPYPNDEMKSEKTSTVYNTNNPEYNTTFNIPIQRSSRPFQRIFKRHAIKLHVWSKGGFLRSDQLVATVQVKLQPLETKCTIHNAFDLMDGRKSLGGKLEVKVRVRNPIVTKQIEQINEKWLIID